MRILSFKWFFVAADAALPVEQVKERFNGIEREVHS